MQPAPSLAPVTIVFGFGQHCQLCDELTPPEQEAIHHRLLQLIQSEHVLSETTLVRIYYSRSTIPRGVFSSTYRLRAQFFCARRSELVPNQGWVFLCRHECDWSVEYLRRNRPRHDLPSARL